jgi:4-hydroxy-tetrahydrodipicolinate reductase
MQEIPLKICIAGANGKMGLALQSVIAANPEKFQLIGCISRVLSDSTTILTVSHLEQFSQKPAVVLDFTRPEFALDVAIQAQQQNIPWVSGTTGFNPIQIEELQAIAEDIPVLWSANMSLGVNLAMALVKISAAVLGDSATIEINEAHHIQKQDAPSGTALALGREIAAVKKQALEQIMSFDINHMVKQHPPDKIGFNVIRSDKTVGDHQVNFNLESEQLSISHHAHNRKLFAKGALKAGQWIQNQPPGFYSMTEVLELKKIITEVI